MPVLLCHSQTRRSDRIRSQSSVPLHSSLASTRVATSSKRSPQTALRKRPRQHSPDNPPFHRTGSSLIDVEQVELDYASTPRSLRALKRQKLIELKMTRPVPNSIPPPSKCKNPTATVRSHSLQPARPKKKIAKSNLDPVSARRNTRSRWASSFASASLLSSSTLDLPSNSSPRSTPQPSALSSSGRRKDDVSNPSENDKEHNDSDSTCARNSTSRQSKSHVRPVVKVAICAQTAADLLPTLGSDQPHLNSLANVSAGDDDTLQASTRTSVGLSSTTTTTETRKTTDFTIVTQDYSRYSPPPLFSSPPPTSEPSTNGDVEMGCAFSRSRSPSASTAIASISDFKSAQEETEAIVSPPTIVVSQPTPLTLRLGGSLPSVNDAPFSLDPELEPSRFGLDARANCTEDGNGSDGLLLEYGAGGYELFEPRETGGEGGLRKHLLQQQQQQQHREEQSRMERRREGNIWKAACRERVDGMFSRYDPETIRSFVAAQAEDDPPRMPFMEYSDSESDYSDEDEDDEDELSTREATSFKPTTDVLPEEQKRIEAVEEGDGVTSCFYASPLMDPTLDQGYERETGLGAGALDPSPASSVPSSAEADKSFIANSNTLEEPSSSSSPSSFQPQSVFASAFSSGYQLPPFTFPPTLSFSMFGFGVPVPLPVPPPPLASLRAMSLLGSAWPVYCGRGTPVDRRRRDDWGRRDPDAGRDLESLFELLDRVGAGDQTRSGGAGEGKGWFDAGVPGDRGGVGEVGCGRPDSGSSSSLSGALSPGLGS